VLSATILEARVAMTEKTKKQKFAQLGKTNKQIYDDPKAAILECFPNPFADPEQNVNGVVGTIHIEAPEFTTLCPITGQPDFATIVIDYRPRQLCVESKSSEGLSRGLPPI
jgi:NADPH-dependent 7-cyano-7-deazaguanine reductase QueF